MADQPVEKAPKRRPPATLIPLPLRNWQVLDESGAPLEIDGEVTINTVEARRAEEPIAAPAAPTLESTDEIDDRIVVSLPTRHQEIEAGATATYELMLLNNGRERTRFALRFAEGHAARWLAGPIPDVFLQPGERTTITVTLTPPRAAISRAGDYSLTFVVTADAYPQGQSQVAARLRIAPFVELKLGKMVAPHRTLTWWRRSVLITVPVINSGNHPTPITLRAQDGTGVCQIAFHGAGLRAMRQQQAVATIPPGRMTPITLQLYAQSQAWFGRTKRICPIQLAVAAKGATKTAQTASLKVALAPVIGPWQVATLVGLLAFVVTGIGLGGLALIIALMVNLSQPAASTPTMAAAPVPSIVTILVQPAASPVGSVAHQPDQAAATAASVAPIVINTASTVATAMSNPQVEERNPSVPLVQPEQVSAPDGAPVVNPIGAGGAPQTATQKTMTYAQMFQEVAGRYDLNWRMLAAQAYVESSFDPLALGSHGDLGLMQIRPSTWREWAPTVTAADPFDSYSNVLVAAAYLDYLRTTLSKRGHAEREWILVAYNWGPDKVLQHLDNGGQWNDLAAERRQYAEEVLRLAETIPPDAAF